MTLECGAKRSNRASSPSRKAPLKDRPLLPLSHRGVFAVAFVALSEAICLVILLNVASCHVDNMSGVDPNSDSEMASNMGLQEVFLPSAKIAVVIPCYKVKAQIIGVIEKIGTECRQIFVVDDCCPEQSGQFVLERAADSRGEYKPQFNRPKRSWRNSTLFRSRLSS